VHTSSLPEKLPQYSLGWGVLDFGTKWFRQPNENSNYEQGQPWRYTREQARFLIHWYAVDEEGEWLYEHGVIERPKGWGKSPFLAAVCGTELLGPVKFDRFEKINGLLTPIGKSRGDACVQIAAISERQTNNTFELLAEMLAGPCQDTFGLELMLTQVQAPGGRKIERVTASPKSTEGNRATFACLDETHLWYPVDRGPELMEVIARNLAKTNGRNIETTNAPVPGKNSVAETSHDTYEQLRDGILDPKEVRMLFDTREVIVEDIYGDDAIVEEALRFVYGDAGDRETGWINIPRLMREIRNPKTSEYNARRFYFNERVQGEAQWIKDHEWAKAYDSDLILKSTDMVTLGFSAATRNGAAAIVACRVHDGALFLVDLWEKPSDLAHHVTWELPVPRVDAKMRKWLKKDNVVYMMGNPWGMADVMGRWAADYHGVDDKTKCEEFWLNQQLRQAKAVDQFENALRDGRIHHDGSTGLKRHITQTFLEEQTHGYTLRKDKPSSNHYIQAAQAAVLAYDAAQAAIEKGLTAERVSNAVYSF